MCRYGDIYWAKLPEDTIGSLQSGVRPVIVVSNDMANEFSPVITVLPLTSKIKKKKLQTHVFVKGRGLKPSIILAEQIMSLNQNQLLTQICSLKSEYEILKKIKKAIAVQLNL